MKLNKIAAIVLATMTSTAAFNAAADDGKMVAFDQVASIYNTINFNTPSEKASKGAEVLEKWNALSDADKITAQSRFSWNYQHVASLLTASATPAAPAPSAEVLTPAHGMALTKDNITRTRLQSDALAQASAESLTKANIARTQQQIIAGDAAAATNQKAMDDKQAKIDAHNDLMDRTDKARKHVDAVVTAYEDAQGSKHAQLDPFAGGVVNADGSHTGTGVVYTGTYSADPKADAPKAIPVNERITVEQEKEANQAKASALAVAQGSATPAAPVVAGITLPAGMTVNAPAKSTPGAISITANTTPAQAAAIANAAVAAATTAQPATSPATTVAPATTAPVVSKLQQAIDAANAKPLTVADAGKVINPIKSEVETNTKGITKLNARADAIHKVAADAEVHAEDASDAAKIAQGTANQVAYMAGVNKDAIAVNKTAIDGNKAAITATAGKVAIQGKEIVATQRTMHSVTEVVAQNKKAIADTQTTVARTGARVATDEVVINENHDQIATETTQRKADTGEIRAQMSHKVDTGVFQQRASVVDQRFADTQNRIDENKAEQQKINDAMSSRLDNHEERLQSLESGNNQKFANMDKKIEQNRKIASRGIAGSNALAGLPQLEQDATFGMAAAAGGYDGQSAMAVGASAHPFENKSVALKAGVTAAKGGNMGWNAGVGVSW